MGTRLRSLGVWWANPVVVRDLRVRMRCSKSYWHQAIYLLLLGLLACAGYASAVSLFASSGNGLSPVEAQTRLRNFYYFIFMTLAALISLIAPSLTASSITTERQRWTLDLLIISPLSSMQLLVGKLISSVAFLALLLSLSLPASALCVVLGGATISDVFQVYVILAIDGLLMAAIGLYFSCAIRTSLAAMVWTYVSVIAFLIVTAPLASIGIGGMVRGTASTSPALTLASLNPFAAVGFGAQSFEIFGHGVPVWLGTALFAALAIRVLVTGAAYRLGNYGGNPAGALRRQLLFVTALVAGVGSYAAMQAVFSVSVAMSSGPGSAQILEALLIAAFVIITPFLNFLFTPVVPEHTSLGTVIDGKYRLQRAFRPEHSGALPYFHLWLLVALGSVVAGTLIAGPLHKEDWQVILLTVFYVSGMGFLFWSIARRAGSFIQSQTAARMMTFIIYAFFLLFPPMAFGMTGLDWNSGPVAYSWILYPLTKLEPKDLPNEALIISGSLCYVLGALVYPFWGNVIPGDKTRREG